VPLADGALTAGVAASRFLISAAISRIFALS
jgi:hypothetical protein